MTAVTQFAPLHGRIAQGRPAGVTDSQAVPHILAADVVGYAELIGADEAGTLAALQTLRRGDGRAAGSRPTRAAVVKTTGDGFLVEFPSAVEAVECGASVQQAMRERRAAVRIGIASHRCSCVTSATSSSRAMIVNRDARDVAGVWPGVVVEENNLAGPDLARLRKALDEGQERRKLLW